MRWRKINEDPPHVEKSLLIRKINSEKRSLFIAEVKRPFNENPRKYNENYYECRFEGTLIELDGDHEWLNPFQDLEDKQWDEVFDKFEVSVN